MNSWKYLVSLSEASEVKMEARSEIYTKFHVKYCFAGSRHDRVRHPRIHIKSTPAQTQLARPILTLGIIRLFVMLYGLESDYIFLKTPFVIESWLVYLWMQSLFESKLYKGFRGGKISTLSFGPQQRRTSSEETFFDLYLPKNPTQGSLKISKIQVWKLSIGIWPCNESSMSNKFTSKFVSQLNNYMAKCFCQFWTKCLSKKRKNSTRPVLKFSPRIPCFYSK